MLRQLTEVEMVDLDNLKHGSLLIPGITLKNLSKKDNEKLSEWISSRANHLILTPAWTRMDLGKILSLKPEIKIEANEFQTNNDYFITTSVKNSFFQEGSAVKGIRFRNNTSSCLVTITTLPVLDYRSGISAEKRIDFWQMIVSKDTDSDADLHRVSKGNNLLNSEDKIILLLFGAQIPLSAAPERVVRKYFGTIIDHEVIKSSLYKLENLGLINVTDLTADGRKLIHDQNLDSFKDVLIKRKNNSNGWDE